MAKFIYNGNWTGMKWNLSSKGTSESETMQEQCKKHVFKMFVRISSLRQFYQISKTYLLWRRKTITRHFLHICLLIKGYLQPEIHFNGSIFGNWCCHCTRVYYILCLLLNSKNQDQMHVYSHWAGFLCPQLWRSWRRILLLCRSSVHLSRSGTVGDRILKFYK